MTAEEIRQWLEVSRAFFEDIDKAAEDFVATASLDDETAVASAAIELLVVVIRGLNLPPVPDPEAQRHFSAGLTKYRDGVERIARGDDEANMSRAIDAINAANSEFTWMSIALDRAQPSD
jgi:predicted transcriptional regulator